MLHSQRLDQRLNTLRKEVRTMTQEKDRGEWVWRDRLERCQRQLKVKDDEMSRQSQYFESSKNQLQHKLCIAWEREQSLQNQIHVLEKQLLHMTVSAATGMAMSSAVRITASTVTHWDDQQRLPSMRGEGEGEEERKEGRRRQWQPANRTEREGGGVDDEVKNIERDLQEEVKETKTKSNEARLQEFILSLQEDLMVLLEREEDGMTERKRLMEQLQEAQEKSQLMCCQTEDLKAELHLLKESETSLMEEIKNLREDNHRLQQIVSDMADQAPRSSPVVPPMSSNTFSYTTAMGRSSMGSSREVSAESAMDKKAGQSSSAKSVTPPERIKNGPLNLFHHLGSEANVYLQSLSLTTETLDEFELGTWCSRGILNLDECPSEESDALREAYRSLQLGAGPEATQQKCGKMKITQQHTQDQQMVGQENTHPKLPLMKVVEEKEIQLEQEPSGEKISMLLTSDRAEDNILPHTQDDLNKALNKENRALANRIQELLDHIEIREEQIQNEETVLRQQISKFEVDRVRLEQESQEQGCLIIELTKKTEDDLNTIMELQQKLVEREKHMERCGKEQCGSKMQSGDMNIIPELLQEDDLEESVDRLVESVLKEEKQLVLIEKPDDKTTALLPGPQDENDLLQNGPQSSLHETYEVNQLTKLVQSLKMEQKELSGNINALRAQQEEVALSVQTQTEAKQQLTRMVWGLKEEKDIISQSLASLKQEREQLTKAVYNLKDERDQLVTSAGGLKEKEQLTKSLSIIQREKETLLESLSSVKEERDQIMYSLQTLQTEREQLSQAVLYLKEEKNKLTSSLVCLEQPRLHDDAYILPDDCYMLMKSVGNLRDEKDRLELSISRLKQEEEQKKLFLQGFREERSGPGATLSSQTQTGGRNQRPSSVNRAVTTETSESLFWTENTPQTHQIHDRGNYLQDQEDLMREIETLGVGLKKSRDELDKSHVDTRRLQEELCHSETRREQAETNAAQMSDKVSRLTNQTEETRKNNETLTTKVKELQSKLTALVREKNDALSLKAQTQEQYNILTAQLKAKTVALEELNSEYIALKQGKDGMEDLNILLVSLRTRYNNMRSKYDALLKKKSPNELDMAPLKAKLSCLVVKCHQRNSLLVQMMEAMHRQGCQDVTLKRQVEQMLDDAALHDYTAVFTPGNKTWDYSSGRTSDLSLKFQHFTAGVMPDQNGLSLETRVKYGELKREKHSSHVTSESTTNPDCSSEVRTSLTGMLKKDANSPVPISPGMPLPVPALKEGFVAITTQLSPSASGLIQAISGPETLGFEHPHLKEKSSPDPKSIPGSSVSPTPPSVNIHISPKRRMSSPEKIINLHEQLEKTLKSMYEVQAPVSSGQQSRKNFSSSSAGDLGQASLTKKQSLSPSSQHANPLPVTASLNPVMLTPPVVTTTVSTKSKTLFKAVASRSAHVTFNPSMFTGQHLKASALSSSSNIPPVTMTPSQAKSVTTCGPAVTISPKRRKEIAAISDVCHTKSPAPIPITPSTSTFNPHNLKRSEANPKITALGTVAPSISSILDFNNFNTPSKTDGADSACGEPSLVASCTPEKSYKSKKSAAVRERTVTARPKPEAPAKVCSVEVIKTVGQSSLMIGWERPPLDELGCSNGTFVYGYRVIVNGDFHKSVMSSACTKCILENVDLTVPVDISVQTLGSNGLSSNVVSTMWT
ncbi:trichohyalin-like [Antennarius striatus]|uniref:trichohyalin-like n=1 Tax=Antennarius striatus TaxID=241820 RepID=UPI0035B05FA9